MPGKAPFTGLLFMCSVRKSLPVGHWLDNQWQYLKIAAAWCGNLMGQTRGWLKSWKENLGMSIMGFENLLFYPEGLECKVAVHSCTSLTSGWPRESIQAGNADEVGVVNCWKVKAMPQHTHTHTHSASAKHGDLMVKALKEISVWSLAPC